MDSDKFIKLSKQIITDYVNARLDVTDGVQITKEDVYVVWLSKTLQNSKALLSTTLSDGMYYELTYNGDKKEVYLDAYKKVENIAVEVD